MYFIIFLATLILYIINKDFNFLYVSALFAIASNLASIGIKLNEINEKHVEETDAINTITE